MAPNYALPLILAEAPAVRNDAVRCPALHAGFERLIGAAYTDAALGNALLRDPRGTALEFGLTPEDAAVVADIRAVDLRSFAAMLLPRIYGKGVARVPGHNAFAG